MRQADLAIATEALDQYPDLVTYPCFSWRHVVVVPSSQALASRPTVSLAEIAECPIVTYNSELSGRSQIDAAFEAKGLEPDIRLAAMDADVIKTYVRHGLGIGILSEMAFDAGIDRDLDAVRGSSELFQPSVTKIALQRGLLHTFAYRFIEMVAPGLSAASIRKQAGSHPVSRTAARA